MTVLIAILAGAACTFYGYALVRFGREIKLLRSQRVASVVAFSAFRERGKNPNPSKKVTVMPKSRVAKRDVA